MRKFFLVLLFFLNVGLLAMHDYAIPALIDGFNANEVDSFSFEKFCEMQEKGSFKLAVLTTDAGNGKPVKTFCSAQGLAEYALSIEAFMNPVNRQPLLGLAVVAYDREKDRFHNLKYYSVRNWFKYVYEILSTSYLPNKMLLLFCKACLYVANNTADDYLRGSYRSTAYAHLNPILEDPARTPFEEQDACTLLAELHIGNTPAILKDFKSAAQYARRILGLQKKIQQYVQKNPLNHGSGIFNSRETSEFAQIILGKIYATGGCGVEQNISAAFNHLECVINAPYAHQYYLNEALLIRASLLSQHPEKVSLPLLMRIKRIRDLKIRHDLQTVLHNDPNPDQKTKARNMLAGIFA